MPLPAKTKEGRFTYADYLTWSDDERWELINGVAYDMTPAPSTRHQRITLDLATILNNTLADGPCQVFVGPLDVRLSVGEVPSNEEISTVVQPDISVICDADKLDEAGCLGAPDFVVEVLSPSTAYKDQTEKLALFEENGVLEYWIVNGTLGRVLVYLLGEDGRFKKPTEYRTPEEIHAMALPGVVIPLGEVFK